MWRKPRLKAFNKRIDFLTFQLDRHASTVIAHPACKAKVARQPMDERPETDSLHDAAYVNAKPRHPRPPRRGFRELRPARADRQYPSILQCRAWLFPQPFLLKPARNVHESAQPKSERALPT